MRNKTTLSAESAYASVQYTHVLLLSNLHSLCTPIHSHDTPAHAIHSKRLPRLISCTFPVLLHLLVQLWQCTFCLYCLSSTVSAFSSRLPVRPVPATTPQHRPVDCIPTPSTLYHNLRLCIIACARVHAWARLRAPTLRPRLPSVHAGRAPPAPHTQIRDCAPRLYLNAHMTINNMR